MSRVERILAPEVVLLEEGVARGVQVEIRADGRFGRIGALDRPDAEPLPRRLLAPGFVNAHSHAFQRGLRGRGQSFPEGAGSFWTWREAMYALVASLDADAMRALTRAAFDEMRAAGITAVGEFHYLHHDASEQGFAFDEIVLDAARAAGIRIVLLQACYRTGGIGAPLQGGQRRFATDAGAAYWAQVDRLAARLDPALQSIGAVAHSIRAVAPEEILALRREALRRGLPFHMHVEEQVPEIDAALAHYGRRPMELLLDQVPIDGSFVAVHGTHTTPAHLGAFAERGGRLCVCPTTEADLGDGLPDLSAFLAAGGALCLGTDSNVRVSMFEEMRWLEYGQRLRHERRGGLRDAAGRVATIAWRAATRGGAEALGIDAGTIREGAFADAMLVDLDAPVLAGWTDDTLLETLALSADERVIDAVIVGGR